MTYTQFLTESANLFLLLRSIVNSIPDIVLTLIFTAVSFSIVIGIVNMLRGIRS